METEVAIVGGGICGLTLAYHLTQKRVPFHLYDASTTFGGVVKSEKLDGFLLEHGPNTVLNKPAVSRLVEQLGLEEYCLEPNAKARERFLVVNDKKSNSLRLEPAPRSLLAAIRSPLLSTNAKLRALTEPFRPVEVREDESVHSFIARRFGADVAEELVAPMLGGIWAADIRALSCRSALSVLWGLEQQGSSLIMGSIRKRRTTPTPRSSRTKLLYFKDGMQRLTQALQDSLPPESYSLESRITALSFSDTSLEISTERNGNGSRRRFTHVALCCPTEASAKLLEPFDPSLASQIRNVPHAPMGVLHLAIPRKDIQHPLNGFGFLVAPRRGLSVLGAIFCSSLFPQRAPDGIELITCFVGGARRPELADIRNEETRVAARREVEQLVGASGKSREISYHYWERAIPNYPMQHYRLLDALLDFETRHPRCKVLGNWREGVSVPDRILAAEEAAKLYT